MLVPVIALADLPEGDAARLEPSVTGARAVAVFHTEGELYAVDDSCTHQDTPLSDGWVEGCWVECPLHAALFDLRTGAPDGPPATVPVRTHPVVVLDGVVHVELEYVEVGAATEVGSPPDESAA